MTTNRRTIVTVLAALFVFAAAATVEAGPLKKLQTALQPSAEAEIELASLQPLVIPPPAAVPADLAPMPVPAMVSSGPQVCIKYRQIGFNLRHRCEPTEKRILCVTNPCTCCKVEVPVCLPCCVGDCPTVHARKALFSQSLVSYDYGCGVRVVVRFERCGDVIVTYHLL